MIRKKAFTLIELLVVIPIIAVLMAILMPSLQRACMQAQNVVCKSNLKSYGLVMRLYNADWNDGFPELCTFWSGNASLQWVKQFDINAAPPYTDVFGEYRNAVCVDGHVEEVTPYDTLKYAIGVK